jgi:hypothetical protein
MIKTYLGGRIIKMSEHALVDDLYNSLYRREKRRDLWRKYQSMERELSENIHIAKLLRFIRRLQVELE